MLSPLLRSTTVATLLLLMLTLSLQITKAAELFSCSVNVTDYPVDMEKLSGTWYEAVRLPGVDVPACVKANAPSALTSDGSYALEINYMNNVNKKWKNTTELLHFPWTEEASNGVFQLTYGSGFTTITFTYKLIATDYNNIAVVCGYSSIITQVSFFKVFTRERQINDTLKEQINLLLDSQLGQYTDDVTIHWVEQSAKCSSTRLLPYLTTILAVLLLLVSRDKLNN